MQRPVRRLTFAAMFAAVLALLVWPFSTRADWGQCDSDFLDQTNSCVSQYSACVGLSQTLGTPTASQCMSQYTACLSQSGVTRVECENATDPNPQPLPVIDQSRSWCMSACYEGCAGFTDPAERLSCYMPCYNHCNENYPKY